MMELLVKPTAVSAKATRRRFTTAEKLRLLEEADACAHEPGAVTALLRREGLDSWHLEKRGPVPVPPDPRDEPIAELERSPRKPEARADCYEWLHALPKVSALFGIPLQTEDETETKRGGRSSTRRLASTVSPRRVRRSACALPATTGQPAAGERPAPPDALSALAAARGAA